MEISPLPDGFEAVNRNEGDERTEHDHNGG
jgi:hypothetical protein